MSDFRERVELARQSWSNGDLADYLSLYHEDIKLHGYSPEPMTKPAVAAFYQQIWTSLHDEGRPNPSLVFHDPMMEGDLYSCRFTMSGVHAGTFMGIAATGRRYVLPGITMIRHANNRAVERWSSADMLGLLIQLGAIPAPTS
ncbi:MAG: ester cyclase [Xanthobacteraceae bacterium]|jgi:predicted ester cyclase